MRYLPDTREDMARMLQAVGCERVEDLFANVPEACRRREPMSLEAPRTEWELREHIGTLARSMASSRGYTHFLGAGNYGHHIPAHVPYLLGRSEFSTAYTPYQPEMSQGTLQAIFEYQTYVARLLDMEVANASLYDGATALAEALLMALRITRKRTVALSALLHPHYREVAGTYLRPTGVRILDLPLTPEGLTDLSPCRGEEDLAAVALQSPNFFGCIEDLGAAADTAHARGALFVSCFTEPLAYGLVKAPGALGADIVCGEGQGLGIPASFGGPGLGMFATRIAHVRAMPGRLVGRTTDLEGRPGFVLTLATREQHIRRDKATSNICTNNSLCALACLMTMASLGKTGFRNLAALNRDKAEYLKEALVCAGCRVPFSAPTFNEFVVEIPGLDRGLYTRLLEKGIIAGLPLAPYYPGLRDAALLCVTETKPREALDRLVEAVRP